MQEPVAIPAEPARPRTFAALAVPSFRVMWAGTWASYIPFFMANVVNSEGTFVPREVVLGAQAGDRVEIVRGLDVGDRIVASANFLVDAESRLSGGMTAMPGMPEHKP